MKIAHINETCGIGSTGKLVLELCQGLIENGYESKIYYSSNKSNYQYSKLICNRTSCLIHAVMSRITGLQGYFSIFSTRKFLKELEKYNPDIIHLHNLHGNYINLKLLFRFIKKHNKAVILTLHDCWFFTGKCVHPINCNKWQIECKECPLLHIDNVNPTFFFDMTRKCFNDKKKWFNGVAKLGIVGVSQWISDEAKKSIFADRSIITINNWIDTEVFKIKEIRNNNLNLDKSKKIVLMMASSISEDKGYNEMIYLAYNLSFEYQLVCVGRNSIRLMLPNNIIHIEQINNKEQLVDLYLSADVCVNTTKAETFGMVTVEAMSCGTPVIVYNNTASAYIVPDGCGVIVNERDGYIKILETVEAICHNKIVKTRKEISEIVRDKYCKEKAITNFIEFYKVILNENNE